MKDTEKIFNAKVQLRCDVSCDTMDEFKAIGEYCGDLDCLLKSELASYREHGYVTDGSEIEAARIIAGSTNAAIKATESYKCAVKLLAAVAAEQKED